MRRPTYEECSGLFVYDNWFCHPDGETFGRFFFFSFSETVASDIIIN